MKATKEKKHVSSLLRVDKPKHSLFDFIDVNINGDQKLFIDPCLISLCKDSWCKESCDVINDFFDEFYAAYRANDYKRKHDLLSHAREVNYTKLGYGDGRNGHGNTAEGLIHDFRLLDELVIKIDTIESVVDLPLIILGFNEDGLSDMITNIIHYQLNEYTLMQLEKYDIQPNAVDTFFTWNADESIWISIERPCYKYVNIKNEDEKLLLTPKRIVRKKYLFSADHFLKRVILEREKNAAAITNSKGKIEHQVTKKELKNRIDKSDKNWRYNYNLNKTSVDSSLLKEYHNALNGFYIDKDLNDVVLDKFIY